MQFSSAPADGVPGNVATRFQDDGTSVNTLVHGNRFGNGPVQWSDTITGHTLPASLYPTGKPSFWTDTLPWPSSGRITRSELLHGQSV